MTDGSSQEYFNGIFNLVASTVIHMESQGDAQARQKMKNYLESLIKGLEEIPESKESN